MKMKTTNKTTGIWYICLDFLIVNNKEFVEYIKLILYIFQKISNI